MVGGADPGQHEQLRAADRPAGHDDLALGPGRLGHAPQQVVHADGAEPGQRYAGHQGVGQHGQVGPVGDRVQVGVGRRPAAAAALRHLVEPDTVLLAAVEVVVGLLAGLAGRVHERGGQRRLVLRVLHAERASGSVEGGGTAGVALGPEEVRQQLGVAPAFAAVVIAPGVVVVPVAADVDHRVNRGRSAEGPAPGPVDRAAARALLRGGLVVPVVGALEERVDGGRDVDLIGVVGRPGLEQQHARGGVLAQPRGEDTAGASSTDDDVVIHGRLPTPVRTCAEIPLLIPGALTRGPGKPGSR